MPQVPRKQIAPPPGSVWIEDAAEMLGVAKSTLYKWRLKKIGPQGYAVARRIAYEIKVIEAHLDDCRSVAA